MSPHSIYLHTEPDLLPVLHELRSLEPIFHTREFGTSVAEFNRRMAPSYWEVGASGRRYHRDFILHHLEQSPPLDARTAGWQTRDHALQHLGSDTYLLTYTLQQDIRLTRRATIWQNTPQGWLVLYHQGTLVSSEQDEVAPPKS